MEFEVGTKVILEFPELGCRIDSRFVGMEKGRYIILRPGSARNGSARLKEGTPFIGRYLHDGTLIVFQSAVKEHVSTPQTLVFATYPSRLQRHNLRKCRRIDCNFPGTLSFGVNRVPCILTDISLMGCRIAFQRNSPLTYRAIPMDRSVQLHFYIFDRTQMYGVQARVKNAVMQNGTLTAGLHFEKMHHDVKGKIEGYINTVSSTFEL